MIYQPIVLVMAAILALPAAADQAQWWPSKWGPEDTLGSFNMLGPELTMKAVRLVKTGKTYRLGIETNSRTPAYPPRTFEVTILNPNQYSGTTFGDNKFTWFEDVINGWMGVGSQIDGLGHAATDDVFYNGFRGKDFVKVDGLQRMGVEDYPPRGVLIDMAACTGVETMKEGTAFNRKEIAACEKQQGVTIEKGDVVLFNTGWLHVLDTDPERFGKVEPGLGVDGAKYLAEKGVMAVGADTWGVEAIPFEDPGVMFHIHQVLINYNGIYILENMDTRELARDKAYEFMFVLGPARITGTVQMIINPIAIR